MDTGRNVTAVGDAVQEYEYPEAPRADRVPGTVTRKRRFVVGGVGTPGYELAMLLQKAAGLEGFRLRSIECQISTNAAVTFKAEIFGNEEDIAKAVAENE